jgi:hypothetical protein
VQLRSGQIPCRRGSRATPISNASRRPRPAGPYRGRHPASAVHPGGGVARATAGRDPGRVPPPSVRSQSKTAVTARRSPAWAGNQSSRAGSKFEPVGVASEPTTRLDDRAGPWFWRCVRARMRSAASVHDNDVTRTGAEPRSPNPVTEIASIARVPRGTEHVVSAVRRQTPQIDPDLESECRTTPLFSLPTVTQSRQNPPGIHTSISRTEGLKHEIQ